MLKSKLFIKSIVMVISLLVIFNLAVVIFTVPKIENGIKILEEKNAKAILDGIVVLTSNVHKDLQNYKQLALENRKKELINLTNTAWSIIASKYEQSKPKNIGKLLEKRAKEFEQNLMTFYNKNKNTMSKKELKKAILTYIKIYRYNNGIGYFWINDFKPNMIMHPIASKLNGKNIADYKDPNGVYLFKKMVKVCKEKDNGIVKYQWQNPKSKIVEDKISYVFTFKPFNWIIGTGEYISVLQKQLQSDVMNIVRGLRYGQNNKNYFFIYDYNNIAISHPHIQGKDMSMVKDKKGNLIVPPFVHLAQKQGGGFTRYWWSKNLTDNKSYEKLTYVKDFPYWKMVIATGVFIDDIEQEVKNRKQKLIEQLKSILNKTKIGKTGYLFIFDTKANMLIHPNGNIDGTNFAKLKNPIANSYLFDDLVKSADTQSTVLTYKWDKPDDKGKYIYDKIAWTRYIPELGWYISSTVYIDEFKESSRDIRDFIFKLFVILFIITLFYSIYFFKKMLTPISYLSNLSLKVIEGNYSVRSDIKQDNEIGILSDSFNKMLNTTEDLISNLDHKIQERTKDLEKSQKETEAVHKHTQESIEYASLIQGALIPRKGAMSPFFEDHFVTWTPKDTVGGDIWLFNKLRHEDECLLFFIDCTGHGVPGAFVTMIVKAIEREIIANVSKDLEKEISPASIMGYFNKTMKKLLRQESTDSLSNAGWDGGIIYYNRRTQIVKFAGAETPLFYTTKDGEFKTVKGNRYSVGYKKCDMNYEYKESIIEVEEGMKFFCTTDGYLDQNGGQKDFPFGKRRFQNIIKEHHTESMAEVQTILQLEMMEWEDIIPNNDRNDDMTVIGFEIGCKSEHHENIIDEIVKYEGIITQNVIASCMDNIEAKIDNVNIMGIVSTITIEYCQNMMNYSKNNIINSREIVPEGSIEVQHIDDSYYEIIAINIISIDDKNKIEPKLIEIQGLDKQGIKKRYRELRKSGQNTHEKGGGIGMYEIAKISDNINYSFEPINDDKYTLIMRSIVTPKKK